MDAFNCILQIFNFYLKRSRWALPYSSSKQKRFPGLEFDGPGYNGPLVSSFACCISWVNTALLFFPAKTLLNSFLTFSEMLKFMLTIKGEFNP